MFALKAVYCKELQTEVILVTINLSNEVLLSVNGFIDMSSLM